MTFDIRLTDDALHELEGMDDYLVAHEGPEKADYVLGKIEEAILVLRELSERGHYPPELSSLGIREYWEVFFKPYRIIYRVIGKCVYVYLIADGRRDMQALLARRLLGQ